MAETTRTTRPSLEQRIRLLTDSYRAILARYERIERLSSEQKRILREKGPIRRVNEILETKKQVLHEIRAEEVRVTGAREWWKRARRSLPTESCRELLSLLDVISRKIERTLSLEAECRMLLDRAMAWGLAGRGAPPGSPSPLAAAAYARGSSENEKPHE